MQKSLSPCILFFSILIGNDLEFQDGIIAYAARAENAQGTIAQQDQIDKEITIFNQIYQGSANEFEAGVYLLKSYYYKGKFAVQDDELKKGIFNLGKSLG